MKKPQLHINKSTVALVIITVLVLVFATYKVAMFAAEVTKSKDAIKFAFEHPELVIPVKEQYETEIQAVQDSLVKRQSLIAPITINEGDLGKE